MAFPIGTWAGGLYGQEMSAADRKRARQELEQALEAYQGLQAPTKEDLSYFTQDIPFIQQAAQERAVQAGPSAMEGISLDPDMRRAQLEALGSLQRLGAGDITAMDRARLDELTRKTAQQERGARGAILQNMQRRGMAGSGLELAAQLQNQQSAADRAAQQALQVEGNAQQRALEALQQSGAMAGRMEGADYQRARERAEAADTIAKFNALQAAGAQQRNVAGMNDLNRNRQDVMNRNIAARNVARANNADAAEAAFKGQLARAQGVSGGKKDLSESSAKRAQDIQRLYTGMGSSADQSFKEDEDRFANLFGSFFGAGMGGG